MKLPREIKFRGMGVNGDWHYGMMARSQKAGGQDFEGYCISNSVGCPFAYRVRPETVGQFTGLHDCDGKEIYEGDIVEFTYWWFDGESRDSELKGSIVYEPECMAFALKGIKNPEWLRHIGSDENGSDTSSFAFFNFNEADFRVIGNIHENSDLLEG